MRLYIGPVQVDIKRYHIFGYSVPVFTTTPEKPEVRVLCHSCEEIIWGMADANVSNPLDAIARHEMDSHPIIAKAS